MLAGYVNIVLIERYFGLDALGDFSFLTTVLNMIALFSMTGVDTFTLKQGSVFYADGNIPAFRGLIFRTLRMGLFQALIAGLLLAGAMPFISKLLIAPYYQLPLVAMVVILPVYVLFYLLNEAHRARGMNVIYSLGNHGYGLVTLLVLGSAIWLGAEGRIVPFWSFAGAAGILLLIQLIGNRNFLVGQRVIPYAPSAIRKMAFPFFLISSVTVLLNWTDILMIRFLENETELGLYHIIYRFGLLVTLPLIALNTILPARFASLEAAGNIAALNKLVQQSTRIAAVSSAAIVVVLMVSLPYLLNFLNLKGDHLTLGTLILALGYLAGSFFGANGSYLMMANEERYYSRILIGTTLLNITLNSVLIPFYGFLGAAIATAICIVVRNLWSSIYIQRKKGLRFRII